MDCSTLSHSLRVSSSVPPGCLYRSETSSVGTSAKLRVMLMRCHCEICMSRKPLITNCPVYTPVMVLLWPAPHHAFVSAALHVCNPYCRIKRMSCVYIIALLPNMTPCKPMTTYSLYLSGPRQCYRAGLVKTDLVVT